MTLSREILFILDSCMCCNWIPSCMISGHPWVKSSNKKILSPISSSCSRVGWWKLTSCISLIAITLKPLPKVVLLIVSINQFVNPYIQPSQRSYYLGVAYGMWPTRDCVGLNTSLIWHEFNFLLPPCEGLDLSKD